MVETIHIYNRSKLKNGLFSVKVDEMAYSGRNRIIIPSNSKWYIAVKIELSFLVTVNARQLEDIGCFQFQTSILMIDAYY